LVEGDSYHRYSRDENASRDRAGGARWRATHQSFSARNRTISICWNSLFREYGKSGTGRTRLYLHSPERAQLHGQQAGTFTPWCPIPEDTDLLFYEGLHGGVVTDQIDVAQHVDC
jgi:phosphoribulokinase